MKRSRRWVVAAVTIAFILLLTGLASIPREDENSECLPDGTPIGSKPCVTCTYTSTGEPCKDIPPILISLALLGLAAFWGAPALLVYYVARKRGIDIKGLVWAWLLFGGFGLGFLLLRSATKRSKEQLAAAESDPGEPDLTGMLEKAVERLARKKLRN